MQQVEEPKVEAVKENRKPSEKKKKKEKVQKSEQQTVQEEAPVKQNGLKRTYSDIMVMDAVSEDEEGALIVGLGKPREVPKTQF